MDGSSISCMVPALADSKTTLKATGTAVRTGKFSPAEVTVKSGTKEWSENFLTIYYKYSASCKQLVT